MFFFHTRIKCPRTKADIFLLQRYFLSQNDTTTSENSQSQVDEKWQLKSYNSKRKYIFKCCKIPLSSTSLPRLQVEICACQKWVLLVPFLISFPNSPRNSEQSKSQVRSDAEPSPTTRLWKMRKVQLSIAKYLQHEIVASLFLFDMTQSICMPNGTKGHLASNNI